MTAAPIPIASNPEGGTVHRRGRRVVRSFVQRLAATPATVLPLLCPVREADWLDGWQADLVCSSSGVAEEGCVFTTTEADGGNSVWVVAAHDRQRQRVDLIRVTGSLLVTMARIDLTAIDDGGAPATTAEITYTFTALSEAGSRVIDERFSEPRFLEMVTWWERSLNHFLNTGERLRRPV